MKVVPSLQCPYLCDSHAESVGEEQASVPFKQRVMPQERQGGNEERGRGGGGDGGGGEQLC